MASGPFKLYGETCSVSCLPVIMTAVEGGISYELVDVHLEGGAHLAPDFRKMNPVGGCACSLAVCLISCSLLVSSPEQQRTVSRVELSSQVTLRCCSRLTKWWP